MRIYMSQKEKRIWAIVIAAAIALILILQQVQIIQLRRETKRTFAVVSTILQKAGLIPSQEKK